MLCLCLAVSGGFIAFKQAYPDLCVEHEFGGNESVKEIVGKTNNNESLDGDADMDTTEATCDTEKYHPSRDQVIEKLYDPLLTFIMFVSLF